MEQKLMRTSTVRAVDEGGIYHDVDYFVQIDSLAELSSVKAHEFWLRVNRQAAKQLEDGTYEVIATGQRLTRVSPERKA